MRTLQTAALGVLRAERRQRLTAGLGGDAGPLPSRMLGSGMQFCHAKDRKRKSSPVTETSEGLGSRDIKDALHPQGASRRVCGLRTPIAVAALGTG